MLKVAQNIRYLIIIDYGPFGNKIEAATGRSRGPQSRPKPRGADQPELIFDRGVSPPPDAYARSSCEAVAGNSRPILKPDDLVG